MTVALPQPAGFDDLQEVSLSSWRSSIVCTVLRLDGSLAYRKATDHPNEWSVINNDLTRKQHIATLVMSDMLLAAWQDKETSSLRFLRYDIKRGLLDFPPINLLAGDSPSLVAYAESSILLAFTTPGEQRYITSANFGDSWLVQPISSVMVDSGSGSITQVDVTTEDAASSTIIFAESDLPASGE